MRKELAEREADVVAVKIDLVGAALKRHPEYLQYDLQLKMPEIYREAGMRGNMVLAAPTPLQLPSVQAPWGANSTTAPTRPQLMPPAAPGRSPAAAPASRYP